jgi:hypothetical protein
LPVFKWRRHASGNEGGKTGHFWPVLWQPFAAYMNVVGLAVKNFRVLREKFFHAPGQTPWPETWKD